MTKLAKIGFGLLFVGGYVLALAMIASWESTLPLEGCDVHVCASPDYDGMTKFRIMLGDVFVFFGSMVMYADYEEKKRARWAIF